MPIDESRRYEYHDDAENSHKYYIVELHDDGRIITHYGRCAGYGNRRESRTTRRPRVFGRSGFNSQCQGRLKKGYQLVSSSSQTAEERQANQERIARERAAQIAAGQKAAAKAAAARQAAAAEAAKKAGEKRRSKRGAGGRNRLRGL